ncbi:MAG: DUF6452 family protein [Flavobacteriaceae bacterium]|nr:DUF6452 family protein [Flavobacteriaceae bacterium]
MKASIYLLLFLVFLSAVSGCERDDLCAAAIPKTPGLVVRFFNASNPDSLLAVTNMRVKFVGIDDSLTIGNSFTFNLDSIAIPLKTGVGELLTQIVLINNATNVLLRNADTLDVSYLAEKEFISKACGFKNNFVLQNITLRTDANNWISSAQIINDTIQDERKAAVRIFH